MQMRQIYVYLSKLMEWVDYTIPNNVKIEAISCPEMDIYDDFDTTFTCKS